VTFSPMFFVLLSRITLGEKIPSRWPVQICFCIVGALLINKPLAPEETCPASTALWPMSAAVCGGVMNLMSRNVKEVPPAVVCMFNDIVAVVFAIVTSAFGILGAGSGGVPTLFSIHLDGNLGLLILVGMLGWAGLMANVKGYQAVSVSAIASIAAFSSVPFGYAIQILVFKNQADCWSIAGATLIVCTNITAILLKYYEEKANARVLVGCKPLLEEHVNDEKAGATQIEDSAGAGILRGIFGYMHTALISLFDKHLLSYLQSSQREEETHH